jgi:hypothetical protein
MAESHQTDLERSMIALGFEVPYVALNQDGLIDPRLTSAIAQAIRDGLVSREDSADLFEADLIITADDNRHAVIEVSITADHDDIDRAKLFEADLIITADDNRHAVIEVSITADHDDIDRAKNRAGILSAITGGTVTPVVITSRLNPAQVAQAEAAGVTTFVMSYP